MKRAQIARDELATNLRTPFFACERGHLYSILQQRPIYIVPLDMLHLPSSRARNSPVSFASTRESLRLADSHYQHLRPRALPGRRVTLHGLALTPLERSDHSTTQTAPESARPGNRSVAKQHPRVARLSLPPAQDCCVGCCPNAEESEGPDLRGVHPHFRHQRRVQPRQVARQRQHQTAALAPPERATVTLRCCCQHPVPNPISFRPHTWTWRQFVGAARPADGRSLFAATARPHLATPPACHDYGAQANCGPRLRRCLRHQSHASVTRSQQFWPAALPSPPPALRGVLPGRGRRSWPHRAGAALPARRAHMPRSHAAHPRVLSALPPSTLLRCCLRPVPPGASALSPGTAAPRVARSLRAQHQPAKTGMNHIQVWGLCCHRASARGGARPSF